MRRENRRQECTEAMHGVSVADPYRWLEDAADPDVQEWMRLQDDEARRFLGALPHRDVLLERFRELFYIDWISAPRKRGDRFFWLRRKAGEEKAVVCFREGTQGAERVLLDPNSWSDDGSVSLGTWCASRDGRLVAYTQKTNNSDSAILRVRDVLSGVDLPRDIIADAKYAAPEWTPDGRGFYYTWLPNDRSIPRSEIPGRAEVRFHRVGEDPEFDDLVHPALNDPRKFLYSSLSRDGVWLFIGIQRGWTATDLYFRNLQDPSKPFQPLVVGTEFQHDVLAWKQHFFIQTNDGASRFRLLRANAGRPAREDWEEIVPEREGTLEAAQIIGEHLVLRYLSRARSAMEVRSLDGNLLRSVELPGIGTVSSMVGEPEEDEAYYAFSSFTEPPAIFRTSVRDGGTERWWQAAIPADPSRITCDQLICTSKDGTSVTLFVVHRKDMKLDGAQPTLLTGYGGFNVSLTPSYRSTALVWAERGGVFVVANLRGGGEYGEDWHRAGMLDRKQNVFDDFVAAAEFLIAKGYTRPDRLAISGGSNGGLLVGAALTQRPDLFGAAICAVPLLDMIRYHRSGTGSTWMEEYGSADDPTQFPYLHAYSPYHRVTPGTRYPALLLMSADSDDRVDPMHARKFAAAVQDAGSEDRPVLLRIERNAGHTGADQVRLEAEQQADQFAFLFHELKAEVPERATSESDGPNGR